MHIRVRDFINEMEDQGYVLYPGKGSLLEKNLFQIANMGQIYPDDCKRIIKVIGKVLKEV